MGKWSIKFFWYIQYYVFIHIIILCNLQNIIKLFTHCFTSKLFIIYTYILPVLKYIHILLILRESVLKLLISFWNIPIYLSLFISLSINMHIFIYRVFIKYCVFSFKCCDFSELCQLCCSAGVLPAWCAYTH